MGTDNQKGLYSIGISNFKDIKFEKGQEILVYFNGAVLTSYPAQIGNVGKIKIIKDKSDIQIPDNIIRFCYNTKDKVNVIISELTNSGIALTITDTNELAYNYSHSYTINKKVKNENYTGVGQKIGEDTENSTSGFTQYRSSIYLEINRTSNISSENTEIYNLPNMNEEENYLVTGRKFDWTKLYGILEERRV